MKILDLFSGIGGFAIAADWLILALAAKINHFVNVSKMVSLWGSILMLKRSYAIISANFIQHQA
jgi:hypothetical protein